MQLAEPHSPPPDLHPLAKTPPCPLFSQQGCLHHPAKTPQCHRHQNLPPSLLSGSQVTFTSFLNKLPGPRVSPNLGPGQQSHANPSAGTYPLPHPSLAPNLARLLTKRLRWFGDHPPGPTGFCFFPGWGSVCLDAACSATTTAAAANADCQSKPLWEGETPQGNAVHAVRARRSSFSR